MDQRNIVLVGFMGCGKSLTSNKLAITLKRQVFSTDTLIEQQEKRSIEEIFKNSGEDFFRKIEREVVEAVSQQSSIIIDCGGGVVLDSKNVDNLRRNGRLIYLSASPETIFENIKNRKNRPLLNVEDPKAAVRELLTARKPYYEQADITVDANDKSIDQIAKSIIEVLANE